jgi:predicted methyltransferase
VSGVRARLRALGTGLALCAAAVAAPAAEHAAHDHHRFNDAQKWARVFDDPARDAWQKPHEVIAALRLAPDAAVADIGAGTGYFAARLSHMVAKGRVYAVDLEPDMVRHLGERAKKDRLVNLTPVLGSAGSPNLPAPVDLVILVDVYHHIAAREQYFGRLRDALKTGGRIAVIDFRMDATIGPSKAMRIAPDRVKAEMAQAGFALAEEHAFLPQQYFLVFRRATP